ncbi:MAG: hypothetical protein QG587_1091 [Chloroflexota bacterium]|nr:hypothetical protein [Chloroflexota bacterium]
MRWTIVGALRVAFLFDEGEPTGGHVTPVVGGLFSACVPTISGEVVALGRPCGQRRAKAIVQRWIDTRPITVAQWRRHQADRDLTAAQALRPSVSRRRTPDR